MPTITSRAVQSDSPDQKISQAMAEARARAIAARDRLAADQKMTSESPFQSSLSRYEERAARARDEALAAFDPFGVKPDNSLPLYTGLKTSKTKGVSPLPWTEGRTGARTRNVVGFDPEPLDPFLTALLTAGPEVDSCSLALLGLVVPIAEMLAAGKDRDTAYIGRDTALMWSGLHDVPALRAAADRHAQQLGRVLLISQGERDEIGSNGRPVAAEWMLGPWPTVDESAFPGLARLAEMDQTTRKALRSLLEPRNALWHPKTAGRGAWRLLLALMGQHGLESDVLLTGPEAGELLLVNRKTGSDLLKRLVDNGLADREGRKTRILLEYLGERLAEGDDGYVHKDRYADANQARIRVKVWLAAKNLSEDDELAAGNEAYEDLKQLGAA